MFRERVHRPTVYTLFEDTSSAALISVNRRALSTLLLSAATGAILWIGATEVAAGRLTAGQLASSILYIGIISGEMFWAGFMVTDSTRAHAAGQRIFEVLDAESPVRERNGAVAMPAAKGHVQFESVSMNYTGERPAIQDVDFEARPGQLVAVLGAPGSGKSTIVHLIPRLYDPVQGRITIDGHDIRDVTLDSLRQNIGIVLQDSFAFATTIKENVGYGANQASMDEIVRAAKIAQLHDQIMSFSEGYDTLVGDRGITLSGGQRQRLAIARTILLDPPILILDDSTSSVDVATESRMQEALAEVVRGRTTFVIAHRLSTVQQADLILVLDHGQIVERGSHDELINTNGYYSRIHKLQLVPQEEAIPEGRAPSAKGAA